MKYDKLIEQFGLLPIIDLASVVQMTGEPRGTIRIQLHRWCKAGRLIALRRGLYALPAHYRVPHPAALSNAIYAPSYISLHWALSFFGLIPEKTVTYTSVTTRKPAFFVNSVGTFRYRHIKPAAFFGYHAIELDGAQVLMADPEKALLDFWHLDPKPWTLARMTEMRFQNMEQVDADRLRTYAERYRSPRLVRAVPIWLKIRDFEHEGTREL